MIAMTASINQIQEQIIEEFAIFDQWMDKYEYIIDLGKKLPIIAPQFKHDKNLVPGCQSRVWLHAELIESKVILTADSDAIITKGIIALLIRVLSAQSATHIAHADLYFIKRIGLQAHLSLTRSNGLVNMVARIKTYAENLAAMH